MNIHDISDQNLNSNFTEVNPQQIKFKRAKQMCKQIFFRGEHLDKDGNKNVEIMVVLGAFELL